MADPTTDDRRRIARHLAAHGPTWGEPLARALGLTLEDFWEAIDCGWFTNVVGGWDLTEQGRREGLGDPPG
jgi:hypothetical protein